MRITDGMARDVGGRLGLAEKAWATAMRDTAELVAALAGASLQARVGISTVSEVVDQGLEALAQLGAVGRTYADLHGRVSALARLNGLDPSAYGESYQPIAQGGASVVVLEKRLTA